MAESEQASRVMPDTWEEAISADSDDILVTPTVGSSKNVPAMEALHLESGGESSPLHHSSASSSEYFSTGIERLAKMRTEYATTLEYEIEASKDHWSEVAPRSATEEEEVEGGAGDELHFEKLKQQCPDFFYKQTAWIPGDYKVGGAWEVCKTLAEGAQGEIFEAVSYQPWDGNLYTGRRDYVMKVFKEGTPLQDLHQQWPQGIWKGFKKSRWCVTTTDLLVQYIMGCC